MVLKLHAVSDGPPSMAVRQALAQLELPYELISVDYGAGQHMTQQYALMNPQKEIPVLDDDGFFLSESNAILQYICDKYKPGTPLYPQEPKARAIVNHRLSYNLSTYYANISAYTKETEVEGKQNQKFCSSSSSDDLPEMPNTMAPIFFDYERTPLGLKKVHMALEVFETYLARLGTSHAAADHLTIADLQLINTNMTLEVIDFDFSQYKRISKWYNDFKKYYPDLWNISADAMKEIQHFATNPPDLSHLNHPIHPAKNFK